MNCAFRNFESRSRGAAENCESALPVPDVGSTRDCLVDVVQQFAELLGVSGGRWWIGGRDRAGVYGEAQGDARLGFCVGKRSGRSRARPVAGDQESHDLEADLPEPRVLWLGDEELLKNLDSRAPVRDKSGLIVHG